MFIKIGLRDLSAPMVAWLRIALAAAVLVPMAGVAAGARAPSAAGRNRALIWAPCRWPGPFLLIALGEQEISSALAGILVATAPIFTAVLAIWVDHEERSEGARLLGIVIGIAGVVALFGLDLSGSGSAVLGGLAVVLAGLGYAVGGFLVKHRLGRRAPDRSRRLGDGGEHDLAAAGGADHGAGLGPRPRPARRRRRAGRRRNRARVRDLLHADRPGRAGALVHRRLPGARFRGRLRSRSCSTSRSPPPRSPAGADPGRLVAGGRGCATYPWRRGEATAPPDSAPRPAPTAARPGR